MGSRACFQLWFVTQPQTWDVWPRWKLLQGVRLRKVEASVNSAVAYVALAAWLLLGLGPHLPLLCCLIWHQLQGITGAWLAQPPPQATFSHNLSGTPPW